MSITGKLASMALAALLLSSCTFHPLDIPDEQWQQMTAEQQLEAQLKQAELNEAVRVRRQQKYAAQLAAEQKTLELRQDAPYGDVVQCTFRNTQVQFRKNKWRPATPISFAIHRAEDDRRISLTRADRPSTSKDIHLGFDGLNVKVCKWRNRDCTMLAGTERAFRRGYSQTVEVKDLVRGTLYCSYPLSENTRHRRY